MIKALVRYISREDAAIMTNCFTKPLQFNTGKFRLITPNEDSQHSTFERYIWHEIYGCFGVRKDKVFPIYAESIIE